MRVAVWQCMRSTVSDCPLFRSARVCPNRDGHTETVDGEAVIGKKPILEAHGEVWQLNLLNFYVQTMARPLLCLCASRPASLSDAQ